MGGGSLSASTGRLDAPGTPAAGEEPVEDGQDDDDDDDGGVGEAGEAALVGKMD